MHSHLVFVLNEIEEFLEGQQDVVDGSYGEPHPNRAMTLLAELQQERKRLHAPEVTAREPKLEVAGFFRKTDHGWVEVTDREADQDGVCFLYLEA